jgi:hypothetical protein
MNIFKGSAPVALLIGGCLILAFAGARLTQKHNARIAKANPELSMVKGEKFAHFTSPAESTQRVVKLPILPPAKAIAKHRMTMHKENFKVGKKMNLSLRTLLRDNVAFRQLNSSVNFKDLKTDDPKMANIQIPRDTTILVLKDPRCSQSALGELGQFSKDSLQDTADLQKGPSFNIVTLIDNETMGSLSQKAESNPCVLGMYSNGSLASASLPADFDLKSLLRDASGAKSFSADGLMDHVTSIAQLAKSNGDAGKVQVYLAGVNLPGIAPNADPTQPVMVNGGLPVPSSVTQVFDLPMPPGRSNQIANLNNSIVLAVNDGAHVVLVPAIDPNAISGAIQYAQSQGAQVMMVPKGSSFVSSRKPASI